MRRCLRKHSQAYDNMGELDKYLTQGGYTYTDVYTIRIHLSPQFLDDPEALAALHRVFRKHKSESLQVDYTPQYAVIYKSKSQDPNRLIQDIQSLSDEYGITEGNRFDVTEGPAIIRKDMPAYTPDADLSTSEEND